MSDTTKQFTGTCVQCGEPIKPADSEGQFKRNRGLHMNKRHGIAGLSRYIPKAAPAGVVSWRGKPLKMDPASVAKREYQAKWREAHRPGKRAALAAPRALLDRARQARWDRARQARWDRARQARRDKHRDAQAPPTNGAPASHPGDAPAVPCQLSECPVCHSRFYVVRGTA